jgi:hypothetical protein
LLSRQVKQVSRTDSHRSHRPPFHGIIMSSHELGSVRRRIAGGLISNVPRPQSSHVVQVRLVDCLLMLGLAHLARLPKVVIEQVSTTALVGPVARHRLVVDLGCEVQQRRNRLGLIKVVIGLEAPNKGVEFPKVHFRGLLATHRDLNSSEGEDWLPSAREFETDQIFFGATSTAAARSSRCSRRRGVVSPVFRFLLLPACVRV